MHTPFIQNCEVTSHFFPGHPNLYLGILGNVFSSLEAKNEDICLQILLHVGTQKKTNFKGEAI